MLRFMTSAALLGATALPAQFSLIDSFYTLTNSRQQNAVQVGVRFFGHMIPLVQYPTGGVGTGAGLSSQGALATSAHGHLMFAVNPGSGSVAMFLVFADLFFWQLDVEPTAGTRPVSVAARGDLVYVLNAGSDSVTGFRIRNWQLESIGRWRLSQDSAGGAQIGFDPSGRWLVATERMTNRILVYPIRADGTLDDPTVNPSAAPTPFGYLFRHDGVLVVSEAAGGMPNASAVSTYRIRSDGTLRTITAAAATKQTAACWIAIPRNGNFAYTTNTGSGTITGYALRFDGSLRILNDDGVTGDLGAGAAPIDFDFDQWGRTLYVLDSAGDEIVAFGRDWRGRLHKLPGTLKTPDGAAGLLAR
jgi:6-phosphogluconolactonase (cycloisomerase 2 family)